MNTLRLRFTSGNSLICFFVELFLGRAAFFFVADCATDVDFFSRKFPSLYVVCHYGRKDMHKFVFYVIVKYRNGNFNTPLGVARHKIGRAYKNAAVPAYTGRTILSGRISEDVNS